MVTGTGSRGAAEPTTGTDSANKTKNFLMGQTPPARRSARDVRANSGGQANPLRPSQSNQPRNRLGSLRLRARSIAWDRDRLPWEVSDSIRGEQGRRLMRPTT